MEKTFKVPTQYTVTEKELQAFYDVNGRVIDALWERLLRYEEEHIIEDIWNDTTGSSFEFLLESMRLRNEDEVKSIQEDTLKIVSDWFDVYGGDENEWRKLEQALRLPLTPLSWEGEEE